MSKWMQNPATSGDAGKRYMSDARAALFAVSGWTETTAPAEGYVPPSTDPITKLSQLQDVSTAGAAAGGIPTATQVTDPGTPQAKVTQWVVAPAPMNPIAAAIIFGG